MDSGLSPVLLVTPPVTSCVTVTRTMRIFRHATCPLAASHPQTPGRLGKNYRRLGPQHPLWRGGRCHTPAIGDDKWRPQRSAGRRHRWDGANLLANQLEAWKARNDDNDGDNDNNGDEQAFAKDLTAAAKAEPALRDSLDELLRRTKALEILIHQTDAAARDGLVQQLARQFAKVNSGLAVKEIYVGGDWINVGNIKSSSYLAIGSNALVVGPGAHVGDNYYQFFGAPPDESARTARRRAYLHYLYTEARRLSLEGIDQPPPD